MQKASFGGFKYTFKMSDSTRNHGITLTFFRRKLLIFSVLSCGDYPIPCGHLLFACVYGIRERTYGVVCAVEMYVS